MRLVTGAALAAVLLLTGCGTPMADPWRDDEAKALEVAWKACEIWTGYPEEGQEYEDVLYERRWDAYHAGQAPI